MKVLYFVRQDTKFARPGECPFVSWDGVERGSPPIGAARQSKTLPNHEGRYLVEDQLLGQGSKKWAVVVRPILLNDNFILSMGEDVIPGQVCVEALVGGQSRCFYFALGVVWQREDVVPEVHGKFGPPWEWNMGDFETLKPLGLATMSQWQAVVKKRLAILQDVVRRLEDERSANQRLADSESFSIDDSEGHLLVTHNGVVYPLQKEEGQIKLRWAAGEDFSDFETAHRFMGGPIKKSIGGKEKLPGFFWFVDASMAVEAFKVNLTRLWEEHVKFYRGSAEMQAQALAKIRAEIVKLEAVWVEV